MREQDWREMVLEEWHRENSYQTRLLEVLEKHQAKRRKEDQEEVSKAP